MQGGTALSHELAAAHSEFEAELQSNSERVESSSNSIRSLQDNLETAQAERDALFSRLEAAQSRKVAATALELRMRNAIAEAHKTWSLLEDTNIDEMAKRLQAQDCAAAVAPSPTGQVDLSTIVQASKAEVDSIVAEFRQRVMGEDNAALVAAESSNDPAAASAAVDFLQMLVEIVEDNGEMRKRVYDYTEAHRSSETNERCLRRMSDA